jgi:hypothetical protein
MTTFRVWCLYIYLVHAFNQCEGNIEIYVIYVTLKSFLPFVLREPQTANHRKYFFFLWENPSKFTKVGSPQTSSANRYIPKISGLMQVVRFTNLPTMLHFEDF